MAATTFKIDKYQVTLGADLPSILTDKDGQVCGIIGCYGGDHLLMINFVKDGQPLPLNSYNEDKKTGSLFLPFSHLPSFVDLLRNEKPIYGYVNSDRPSWNNISTRHEPVGEGEK
jgi:hypothetical protein